MGLTIKKSRVYNIFKDINGKIFGEVKGSMTGKENEAMAAENAAESEEETVIRNSPYQAPEGTTGEQLLEKMRTLIGFEEMTAICEEIHQMAPLLRERHLERVIRQRAWLFSIEPGGGVTTASWTLANLMNVEKLVEPPVTVIEIGDISGNFEESLINGNVIQLLAHLTDRVVVMDLVNLIEGVTEFEFTTFLTQVQEVMTANNLIPVFLVPYIENTVLLKVQNALMDVLNLETVQFVPPSFEQYTDAALQMLTEYGYTSDDTGRNFVRRRLLEEISDGRYYGFKTVRRIADEMVYGKLRGVSCEGAEDDAVIRGKEVSFTPEEFHPADPEKKLDQMAGMRGEVADSLKKAVGSIRKGKNDKRRKPIHMCFSGGHGTGKSTAAHVLAAILAKEGLLEKDLVIECCGEDLIGTCTGSTGPLVSRIFRDACGAVLFIDHAAGLLGDDETSVSYAIEARKALTVLMADHAEDTLVILAGTPKDMKHLLESDPELAAAAPVTISFPDYTRERLADLFMEMVAAYGFEPGEGLEKTVRSYFGGLDEAFIGSEEFANARYVNNYFECTVSKFLTRIQLEGTDSGVLTRRDFEEAAGSVESCNEKVRSRVQIGFRL